MSDGWLIFSFMAGRIPLTWMSGALPSVRATEWPVEDGNHRLLAALARGDKTILASCAGDEERIEAITFKTEVS